MEPKIWGPSAWIFLHSVTLNYPDNQSSQHKENYKKFFESLGDVLPCPTCKKHYKENIIKNPIRLDSKDDLTKWLIDIHNKVNETNGKELFSYESFNEKYEKLYSQKNMNPVKIVLSIVLLVLIYKLVKKYYK